LRWKLIYSTFFVPSKHEYKTSFGEIWPKNLFCCCFLCAVCLPASLIMHVAISELHAQWHLWLHFSMSLNSQRFLQLHPTVMLVAYVNSCFIIIRQNFFVFLFLAESDKILIRPCACFPSADIFSPATTDIVHAYSKRSPKVIWRGAYIVIQTRIYVQDVFSWKQEFWEYCTQQYIVPYRPQKSEDLKY